jgi:ParB family transcriptional regulator, chromosome partitioning protein
LDRRPGAIAHGNVVARDVGLDMVAAGWTPTVDNYLGRVPKARILEAVREGCGEKEAQLIDHLKKGDMAREAERLLADRGWLPESLRLPEIDAISDEAEDGNGDGELQDIDGDEEEDGEPGDDNVVNLPAYFNETADDIDVLAAE